MTFFLILAFSSFLISLLGTRLTILALRKRIFLPDRPSHYGTMRAPAPSGGGIAFVFATIICLLVADIDYAIVLALFMLAAVSLLDDVIDVPLPVRLLVQLLAVLIVLGPMRASIFSSALPHWLDKGLAALLWIWFINLFNLMDGVDGLSATQTTCIGSGLCLITAFVGKFTGPLSLHSLIVASAGCGFLWWNWHPAKIFLGEVGSIPAGFLTGYLLLTAAISGYGYAALILPAYYLCDGAITLGKRVWRHKKFLDVHEDHYYQRAVRLGRSHESVVRYVFGINLLLMFLAVRSVIEPDIALIYLAVAYMAVCMLLGFFAHTRPQAHEAI